MKEFTYDEILKEIRKLYEFFEQQRENVLEYYYDINNPKKIWVKRENSYYLINKDKIKEKDVVCDKNYIKFYPLEEYMKKI